MVVYISQGGDMTATAYIDPVVGRAYIKDRDGREFFLSEMKPGKLQKAKGLHLGMFFPEGPKEERPAGEYPYTELVGYVLIAERRHRALLMLVATLDREISADLRQ